MTMIGCKLATATKNEFVSRAYEKWSGHSLTGLTGSYALAYQLSCCERDIVAPCFFHQHGELYLVDCTNCFTDSYEYLSEKAFTTLSHV